MRKGKQHLLKPRGHSKTAGLGDCFGDPIIKHKQYNTSDLKVCCIILIIKQEQTNSTVYLDVCFTHRII